MAGDPHVDPLLDLGSEMENFDGHGFSPCTLPGAAGAAPGRRQESGVQPNVGLLLTDFNICHSILRDPNVIGPGSGRTGCRRPQRSRTSDWSDLADAWSRLA